MNHSKSDRYIFTHNQNVHFFQSLLCCLSVWNGFPLLNVRIKLLIRNDRIHKSQQQTCMQSVIKCCLCCLRVNPIKNICLLKADWVCVCIYCKCCNWFNDFYQIIYSPIWSMLRKILFIGLAPGYNRKKQLCFLERGKRNRSNRFFEELLSIIFSNDCCFSIKWFRWKKIILFMITTTQSYKRS